MYSEEEIKEYVEEYANFYGVEVSDVLVDREMEENGIVRFRLSLDTDGKSHGCDECY